VTQVASLYTTLTLESSGFTVGLKQALSATERAAQGIERQMNRISAAGAALASAFAVDAIVAASRRSLEYASSLGEVSQQLGVSTRDLQVYRYAASQVGIEQGEMDAALSRLTRTLGEAAVGSKAQAATFRELGVSVRDASGRVLTAGEAIPKLADALSRIKDPALRARLEVDLFGKAGQKLDTLLAGGSTAVNELRDAASKLGLVLEDSVIAQADEAADKLTAVKSVLEAKLSAVVAENAGVIIKLADAFMTVASAAAEGGRQVRAFFDQKSLSSIDARIRQNQEDRASGRGARTSYLGGLFETTRPATAQDNARLDAEFKALIKQRNDILAGRRSSPAAPPVPPRLGSLPGGSGRSAARSRAGAGSGSTGPSWEQSTLEATRALMGDLAASASVNADAALAESSRRFYDVQGIETSADWQKAITDRIDFERDLRLAAADEESQRRADGIQRNAVLFEDLLAGGVDNFVRNLRSNMLSIAAQFVARLIAGQSFKIAGAGALGSILPGFASGGSMTIGGRSGIDRNVLQLNGMPIARVSRGETIDVRNGSGAPQGRGGLVVAVEASSYFDARVREVSAPVAATFAQGAVMGGAALAQRKAGKAASRRMGRG
jgi:hypothetical protein